MPPDPANPPPAHHEHADADAFAAVAGLDDPHVGPPEPLPPLELQEELPPLISLLMAEGAKKGGRGGVGGADRECEVAYNLITLCSPTIIYWRGQAFPSHRWTRQISYGANGEGTKKGVERTSPIHVFIWQLRLDKNPQHFMG